MDARVGHTHAERVLNLDAVIIRATEWAAHINLGRGALVLRRRVLRFGLVVVAHVVVLPKRALAIGGGKGPARRWSRPGRAINRPAAHQANSATAIPTRISET